MTHDDLRRAIESRIAAAWTATPLTFDNLDFTPTQQTSWLRIAILDGSGDRITLGAPGKNVALSRFVGIIIASVFVPENSGSALARQYAATLDALFRDVTDSGIIYLTPYLTAVGAVEGWWQLNVTIPFHWDDIK